MHVKSESDTTPINIPLIEYDPGIYINNFIVDDKLQLSNLREAPSYGPYRVKIVDEELLTFTLKYGNTTLAEVDVMMDRGEFAAVGMQYFFCDTQFFSASFDCPHSQYYGDIEDIRNDVKWWNAGHQIRLDNYIDKDIPKNFIIAAADPLSTDYAINNEADFLASSLFSVGRG
ncbi:MAG: hypothetical protein GY845_04620 [Planctomycetes bacterium]|nr:hypothetical protein [Planctomycetota bacterium]